MGCWNFLIVVVAIILYSYVSHLEFYKKVSPASYKLDLPPKLDGALTPNDKLDKAEKLFENDLHWPESFAVKSGVIYTGLGDGRIVMIKGDKLTNVTTIGKECAGQHEEHICGRPLGMEFGKDGLLYVVDAYHGLFSVDVNSGKKEALLPSTKVVEGHRLTFLNDLAIDEKEKVIYVTQSSTKWNISDVLVGILEHESSGRLLKYDMKTKKLSVILTDMSFPNGVELSHDGNSLLIAEGNKHKIFKYFLKGNKKPIYTVLPFVLPGEPDNISKSKKGTYWVGLSSARSNDAPAIHDVISEWPILRTAFLYAHRTVTAPISGLLKYIPHKMINEIGFELGTARILADLPMQHGIIIEFNEAGKIIQSLHSPSGQFARISEVLELNGYLYLGSWRNRFLGRLKV